MVDLKKYDPNRLRPLNEIRAAKHAKILDLSARRRNLVGERKVLKNQLAEFDKEPGLTKVRNDHVRRELVAQIEALTASIDDYEAREKAASSDCQSRSKMGQ